MVHLLHIDSSPRGERSVSRMLTKEFVTKFQAAYPDTSVTYRDLGHYSVPFVSEDWIAAAFSAPTDHTPEMAAAIRISNELVDEFLAADFYVIGVPMYNFAIPAVFKAYLDQIIRAGRTFAVDESGNYQGLVQGKKMVIITARGGTYPEGTPYYSYDMQEPYLRLAFGFIGITDIQVIHADNLMAKGDVRDQAIATAKSALAEAVK
ncbi:FMN-dependent NADH-azoreductase [Oscillatoria sp. FACHB-1407]|uniref:FMN-dependent NADH-azoreductase n=1 Tax=Oscillatoria sp. FACHB-1407 TaxID=2692847 RepID=UPI001684F0A2|nr:FMN-dependent NADH-azoreductase [Oscillatoria sp. FACHB-1407]MBD2461855.1 FMN-dependent NADH-azoreductase [Oscillatoria sp. FACHB-1407]